MKFAKIALLACGIASSLPSLAGAVVVSGNTAGGPTYNRPLGGTPPAALSSVGDAVNYEVTGFSVSAGGTYSVIATAAYDNFLGLYAGSFDPTAPLTNALVYNDDFPKIGMSGFSSVLLAGTSYFAVATSFADGVSGAYSLEISGPGSVSIAGAVPEPASWALMIAGFGMVGGVMRRRSGTTMRVTTASPLHV
ncbi:MAG: PEPxxWA-CTERM sorting domain-containing protein [Janthinobacterium lividum]